MATLWTLYINVFFCFSTTNIYFFNRECVNNDDEDIHPSSRGRNFNVQKIYKNRITNHKIKLSSVYFSNAHATRVLAYYHYPIRYIEN